MIHLLSSKVGTIEASKVLFHSVVVLFIIALGATQTHAQSLRTQTLELVPGWNSVYLEVDPSDSSPEILFAGTPVDVVASHSEPGSTAQFATNPGVDMLQGYGWAVWYSPERGDHVLSSLYSVYGGQGYLIHSRTNASFEITGDVPVLPGKWIPNAYNFVGFTLQSPGEPTFAQFFSSSAAHNHNKIYRLKSGIWRQVLDPAAEVMRSGEAFWIYCDGHSSYTGPLAVSVPSVLGLVLERDSGSEIVFRNNTDHPVAFWVDHLPDQNTPLPMQSVIRAYDTDLKGLRDLTVSYDSGPWSQSFPALDAGAAIRFPLLLKTGEAPKGASYSLLRIQSDVGTEVYIPVTAYMEDLD